MKLLRPYIPIETRCRVALRQIGEMFPDQAIDGHRRNLRNYLFDLLSQLAVLLNCEMQDLRLDHDPALGQRRKIFHCGPVHVGYDPPANSEWHLIYRIHADHVVKTIVRGERGQLSDIALIKRHRRLEEKEGTRPPSYRTRMRLKRQAVKAKRGKTTWPKRPLRGTSKWPKRKFNNRKGKS
jgi:hypothetical protein